MRKLLYLKCTHIKLNSTRQNRIEREQYRTEHTNWMSCSTLMATKKEKMTKGRECVCVFAPKHQQHPTKRKEVEDKFSVRLCVCRPVYIIKDKKWAKNRNSSSSRRVIITSPITTILRFILQRWVWELADKIERKKRRQCTFFIYTLRTFNISIACLSLPELYSDVFFVQCR